MGPFRQEVVLDKPDAFKPHLLSEPYLIDDLPYALMFRLRGGRPGHLYLVEQTKFHAMFPLSEVHMQRERGCLGSVLTGHSRGGGKR